MALAASGSSPTVTVRVEGRTRTLLGPKSVQVPSSGSITKGGAPSGQCPASSAQGALDAATRHRWNGKWFSSFGEYEIFTILGENENGKHYFWEIFLNNVESSSGACQISLKPGDQLLFAAVPTKGNEFPAVLRGPSTASAGEPFRIQAVYFNAAGKAKPLARARVTGSGVNVVTNSHGSATIDAKHSGRLVLRSSPRGFIRAAPLTVQVQSFY